jgi:hypothetical protein
MRPCGHAAGSALHAARRGVRVQYTRIRIAEPNLAHNVISDTKWTIFEFGEKRAKNG